MAYGPTYLELVNTVLVRLRESEVSATNSTTYSSLIADFVNQAKREVENAWRWQDLREEFSITTANADYTYSLSNVRSTDERLQVLWVFNDDTDTEMDKVSWERMKEYKNATSVTTGDPTEWTPNGQDASGNYQIDVHPTPTGAGTLKVFAYAPQPDLSSDADRMYCPSRPVIELALARAMQERGEDGGQGSLNQYVLYNQVLSDAIAIDANQHEGDITWRAV